MNDKCVSHKHDLVQLMLKYAPPKDNMSKILPEAHPSLCECMEDLTPEQKKSCKESDTSWCSGEDTVICNQWRDYVNRKINTALNMVPCEKNLHEAISSSVALLDKSDRMNPLKVKKRSNTRRPLQMLWFRERGSCGQVFV